jgi:excinuclease ABC subunit B
METFRLLAGYSLGKADVVRRAMSKKKMDVLLSERESTKPQNMTVYPLVEDHYAPAMAAESMSEYQTPERIKELIKQAHDDMTRAAKSLDYLAAARYRDQMRELEKLLK